MDLLYRVKTLWAALRGNHYTWPAIDITLPGNRHFHLIGSIHMGSHDMAPLPTRLLKKLKNADALIVEADVSTSDTPFANVPTCEALEERINEEQLQNLQHISQEMGISPSLFSTQPLWQIAMVLQATQAQKLGLRAEYGIDYQLLQAAKQQHKPVIELEGAENQITMLLQLPDKGLALLDDTLTHWHTNARLLQQMMSWWLNATLTLRQGNDERTVIVKAITEQRRPASEAALLYEETAESVEKREKMALARKLNALTMPHPDRRPDKKERRDLLRFKHGDSE